MKCIYTLIVLCVSLCGLTAKSKAQTANKTTLISSRLRASVNYGYVYGAYSGQDSTTFDYAPPRGAWTDGWEEWKYSTKSFYDYNTSISVYNPNPSMRYMLSFNSSDEVTGRIAQRRNPSTSSWENVEKDVISYVGTGMIDTVTGIDWDSVAGTWKSNPSYRETYEYNTLYQLAQKTYQEWSPSYSSLRNRERYQYTWLSSGKMDTRVKQKWDLTAWKNSVKELFSWDVSNNNIGTQWFLWGGYVWDTAERDTHSDFHGNKPGLTLREMHYTSGFPTFWRNYYQCHTTYNTSNDPTYRYYDTWNMATNSWEHYEGPSSATRWYYENYDPTATINLKELPGQSINVLLYPVPAVSELRIDITWQEAQAFSAAVYDQQGRRLSAWQQPAAHEYHDKLDVSILPAGCYYLRITSTGGIVSREFTILR